MKINVAKNKLFHAEHASYLTSILISTIYNTLQNYALRPKLYFFNFLIFNFYVIILNNILYKQ